MLKASFLFLVLAIVAAILGFGEVAGAAAGVAQVLFFVFIALFAIGLIASVVGASTAVKKLKH